MESIETLLNPKTNGLTMEEKNNALLGNFSTTGPQLAADTFMSVTDNPHIRHVHIPYILNGELYEIQTQEGENVTVKCCNCPPDRVYRGSVRSTGNFHMHIKRRHPDLLGKLHEMKVNALLERRDRFMKNRKLTRRRCSNVNGSRGHALRSGHRITSSAHPPPGLFKIKAAFQRHQLQHQEQHRSKQEGQRQQHQQTVQNFNAMHKCNTVDPFGNERARNVPLIEEQSEQPLNYSMKQYDNQSTVLNANYAQNARELDVTVNTTIANCNANEMPLTIVRDESVTEYQLLAWRNQTNNQTESYSQNVAKQQRSQAELPALSPGQPDDHVPIFASNSDQSLFGRATTMTAVTPCPSDVSSYAGSYVADSAPYELNFNHLGAIKHELYLSDLQPLDLSMQPPASVSPDFAADVGVTQTSSLNRSGANLKCDELFLYVTNPLQNLQHEMQVHNQISSNRLCFEVAKFKFLHPEFEFQH